MEELFSNMNHLRTFVKIGEIWYEFVKEERLQLAIQELPNFIFPWTEGEITLEELNASMTLRMEALWI